MANVKQPIRQTRAGRRSARFASTLLMERQSPPAEAVETDVLVGSRRNPKRKSSHANGTSVNLPEDLLSAVHEPLADHEREEFEGWVELESDPGSFNYILKELGVQGVHTQELFSVDQDSLDLLPKPVYGLIFLFQYQPEASESDEDERMDNVWFANQTSHNACATVALLNIAMNAEDIELGEKLRDFKAATLPLSPPLRGDRITVNSFIRTKHNSFASRMNLLNADLSLENDFDNAERASKRRASPKKSKGRAPKRGEEYAFHFIAYVAAGDAVWELDGLRQQPNKLGPVDAEDWTTVARPQIEARIMQYAESQLAFNLLALCQNTLASHRQQIIHSVASLRYIRAQMSPRPEFGGLISGEELPLNLDDSTELSKYDLEAANLSPANAPPSIVAKMSKASVEVVDAYELYHSHTKRAKDAMAAYERELGSETATQEQVQAQKAPWIPAIHKWMTALAEKDALLNIIKNS